MNGKGPRSERETIIIFNEEEETAGIWGRDEQAATCARSAPRNYYETVMPFKKGHKLSPGGKKGNKGGRPTREQAAEKESFRQALERKREAKAGILADKYYEMALNDPATMRHVVDKVIPPIERLHHSGDVGVREWRVDAYDPDEPKKPKQLVDAYEPKKPKNEDD